MSSFRGSLHWIEGKVDRSIEHIVLTYGNTSEGKERKIAYVMPINSNVFIVQFTTSIKGKENIEIFTDSKKQLDFYLVEKQEHDPWKYLKYHCTTSANEYSKVHWRLHSGIHEKRGTVI